MYSLIFGWLAITIIRPALFGQSVKLGFSELPRNQIIMMLLDAMHYARIDGDMILEDLLYERLTDIMRDYDEIVQVTDSTRLYREKNLYEKFKRLTAKEEDVTMTPEEQQKILTQLEAEHPYLKRD